MRNKLFGLLGSVLLAACGGGDGGGGDDDVVDVDAAVPTDAPDASEPDPDATTCPAPITVFLNFGGGEYFDGAVHDSSTNTTSVLTGDHTIPAYAGAIDVDALVTCVREQVAPFHVAVTTTDPGAAPHREIVYVDGSESIGFQAGISNLAPYVCPTAGEDSTPRSIGFVFPDELGEDTAALCVSTAQTIGYTFALDHAYYCPDNMAFLTACDDKSFVDMDVPCGETAARPCTCGGTTQNSFQRIAAVAGLACDAR